MQMNQVVLAPKKLGAMPRLPKMAHHALKAAKAQSANAVAGVADAVAANVGPRMRLLLVTAAHMQRARQNPLRAPRLRLWLRQRWPVWLVWLQQQRLPGQLRLSLHRSLCMQRRQNRWQSLRCSQCLRRWWCRWWCLHPLPLPHPHPNPNPRQSSRQHPQRLSCFSWIS